MGRMTCMHFAAQDFTPHNSPNTDCIAECVECRTPVDRRAGVYNARQNYYIKSKHENLTQSQPYTWKLNRNKQKYYCIELF